MACSLLMVIGLRSTRMPGLSTSMIFEEVLCEVFYLVLQLYISMY